MYIPGTSYLVQGPLAPAVPVRISCLQWPWASIHGKPLCRNRSSAVAVPRSGPRAESTHPQQVTSASPPACLPGAWLTDYRRLPLRFTTERPAPLLPPSPSPSPPLPDYAAIALEQRHPRSSRSPTPSLPQTQLAHPPTPPSSLNALVVAPSRTARHAPSQPNRNHAQQVQGRASFREAQGRGRAHPTEIC